MEPVLLSSRKIGIGNYADNISYSTDGEAYLTVRAPKPYSLYSPDSGETWLAEPLVKEAHYIRFVQLADGSFIGFDFNNKAHDMIIDRRQKKPQFIIAVYRAASISDIRDCRIDTSFCFVDVPGLVFGYGDSGNSHAGAIDHGVVQLENGDIIVTMYGQRDTDTTVCPYFDENCGYRFYLYSCWCIISHDNGKTFSFYSDIADVQTYPIADVNAEGYCEPDLLNLGGGHILCVIRTGGHEVYSPIYFCHSYDSGKTWSAPEQMCDWGVMPKLLAMSDGTIVCGSGHIHTMLLFSHDEGKTWSEPFIVEPCDGKWDKSPSGYISIYEGKPGELTVIYDDPKEGVAERDSGNARPEDAGWVRNVYIRKYKIF